MYAVIKVGGKQERVEPGDVIEVEFMKVDPGSQVEFQPILVVDDDGKAHVGKSLQKARVLATLVGDRKGDKIRVFKYRPKSGYRRTQGHRQLMTVLEVQEVGLGDGKKATKAEKEPAAEEAPARKQPAKKPPARKPPAKKPAAKKPPARKPTAKKPAARKPAAKKTTRKTSSRKSSG
jgi:large subunit ribosomal protein L21